MADTLTRMADATDGVEEQQLARLTTSEVEMFEDFLPVGDKPSVECTSQ